MSPIYSYNNPTILPTSTTDINSISTPGPNGFDVVLRGIAINNGAQYAMLGLALVPAIYATWQLVQGVQQCWRHFAKASTAEPENVEAEAVELDELDDNTSVDPESDTMDDAEPLTSDMNGPGAFDIDSHSHTTPQADH